MNKNWLSDDLWRAHVSWLTPGWVDDTPESRKDFDTIRWLDQIQSAHYQTLIFYTKFHDGHCTYPSRCSDYCTDRDYFGECTMEARKRGMRIVAYYSSILDQNIGSKHPEWQVMGRDGQPAQTWATIRWPDAYCCINHPEYKRYMLGQITELCENYRPDGIWLDVFEPLTTDICFCPSCQAKYSQETKGGSLFDTHDMSWYQSCYTSLLAEIRALIHGIQPNCVLGQNTGVRHPEYDPFDDFYTREAFTAPSISLYCRSMRPLGKPFETTSRLYSSVHSWAIRAQERVLLESLASVVHGGASCMELSPTPTGKIMDEALHRVAKVGSYIRSIEPYLLDANPIYDVGVFQPDFLCGGPWGTTTPPGGWTSVLSERDLPYACLYPPAELSTYPVVILDDSIPLDETIIERIAGYVAQGGNLIVERGSDLGIPGQENLLCQVLGIHFQGKTIGAAHYLCGLANNLSVGMGEDDLIVEGDAYQISVTTAQSLAYFRYEITDRKPIRDLYLNLPPKKEGSSDPAITLNRYGKGLAIFIACPLTTGEIRNHRNNPGEAREYPTQLAANLVRALLKEPLLRGTTPPGVEVVVNLQTDRHVVHLLNNYITGQYFDNRESVLKLANVPVSINENRTGPIRRAFQVFGNEKVEIPILRDGKWAEVCIPELGVHTTVLLEH
jgi:hypothetical protein